MDFGPTVGYFRYFILVSFFLIMLFTLTRRIRFDLAECKQYVFDM